MKKIKTIQQLKEAGVIVVVRANSKEEAILASKAAIDGGLTGIEVTYTTPQATEVIQELVEMYKNNPEVIIGAGTVLEEVSTMAAINAGAAFVVSPCFDEASAKMSNLFGVPYLPGCLTPTEIRQALTFGVDVVKLFPGSAFSPSYIKNIKAPLPQANIMPTGGVNLDNMHEWFDNGVFAVGVGGDLMAPLAKNDYAAITEKAKAYRAKFLEVTGK
ncbi:MAG: bifunctional 2-keto-4-hydroxyglutarate aldolase/2-keto-3-deoxy-6-phosphogluconate aldolase [Streptococcaceae bacterium]|nr:bifunctional 2-keto-4-hydroxyglutarate aldolase/2-keto-3-deoxy-6-phosphogluconate aldolase [Streptococcaceae bacterium]